MDKRLINFMLLSMLIIVGYMQINLVLFPPPPPPEDGEAGVVEVADDAAIEDPEAADDGADEPGPAEAVLAESEPDGEQDQELADPPRRPPAQRERFTIGSLDPNSPYPFLVTLISEGAAVERIELNSPRYLSLEDKSAYIGQLALETAADMAGVRINVVGHGTPAAQARPSDSSVNLGLRAGDVITEIGDQPVSTPRDVEAYLAQLKAGAEINLEVTRSQPDAAPRSLRFALKSRRRPMEVVRPEPRGPDDEHPLHQRSFLLNLSQVGHRPLEFGQVEFPELPSMRDENWYGDVSRQDGVTKVEFRFRLRRDQLKQLNVDGQLEVVKRFWLQPNATLADEAAEDAPPQYHFSFEVEVINQGQNPIEAGFRLDGPTGLPLEGWWYAYKTHPTSWGGAGVRDIIWRAEGPDEPHQMITNPKITKQVRNEPDNPRVIIVGAGERKALDYLGVDAQYFNCSLLGTPLTADAQPFFVDRVTAGAVAPVDEVRDSRTDVTFRLDSVVHQIQPGESLRQDFRIFAGPKKDTVLAAYGLEESIVYGWFKMPARWMGNLLHFLHRLVGNYALAIILLTVVVKGCMFPIGRQQAMNAKKMQELAPEIKKIKEKHPNDLQKQTAAQQELFRKHKYNPVAGCLPLFLQLPIFIGLYRALSVDIELRQTPLIPGLDWASNLAAPDMFFRWDGLLPQFLAGQTGWLGPYLNILPLVSVALFLVHQKMFTPPPTDEQQEMQQKVMKFMTLFIGFLFFKVPAGLCIYFITSSLWALGERKLLPNTPAPGQSEPVNVTASKPKASRGGTDGNGASARKQRRKKSRR